MKAFKNEVYTDFTRPENRRKMERIIADVESQLGREYPLIIGGERIRTESKLTSLNPSKKGEVIGIFQKADEKIAEKAMEIALKTFEAWRFTPAPVRANYLFKIAAIMRRRKHELAAWMVLEVGKNWMEADGDVAEAIDFCEFYAREALRYGRGSKIPNLPGEKDEQVFIPLGVGLVVPPWNFPLAILTGMTTAAMVAGNTVILKPSSDSPAIAAKFMEIVEEAKVPVGVVNFMTGSGAIAGDYLVRHPKIRFIAFTGSKDVGLRIVEQAGKTAPGQIWIKRVIAEMGGKDAIIVDRDADLDSAVSGVLTSAFGFQGQKCSACSRLILDDRVYDAFMEKFIPRVEAIKVGPVRSYDYYLGPVINENAYNSILEYINVGKHEGSLLCGGEPAADSGWYIRPTVIAVPSPKARIFQEEIFGPVLAVIRSRDFDQSIEYANDSEYGLTGAVYSLNRKKLEKARREFFCGNLYLNRKCTGAMVGSHPFGGFNMSGTDSKAGGPEYLLLFSQAKAIAENLLAMKKTVRSKKSVRMTVRRTVKRASGKRRG